jgi:hypothetical protein
VDAVNARGIPQPADPVTLPASSSATVQLAITDELSGSIHPCTLWIIQGAGVPFTFAVASKFFK